MLIRLFVGGGLVLAVSLVMTLWFDPVPVLDRAGSFVLGRPVSIASAHVELGNPLILTVGDVHIANRPWGRSPDFIHIDHLVGLIDWGQIWLGRISFKKLSIDGFDIWLERDSDGTGNWKQKNAPPSDAASSRRHIPVILDLDLINSKITMFTSSNHKLTIGFKNLIMSTARADAPVHLAVEGTYNDIPVNMDIETQSFNALHQTDHPFEALVKGSGNSVTLQLNAKFMDPLNADQFEGFFNLTVLNIGLAAAYIGSKFHGDLPFGLKGVLRRQGDVWDLQKVTGSFANSSFANSFLTLYEGARLEPDTIISNVQFSALDLNGVIDKFDAPDARQRSNMMEISDHPGTLLQTELNAKSLSYKSFTASDVDLHASLKNGSAGIDRVTMKIAGGSLQGELMTTAHSGMVMLKADHTRMEQWLHIVHEDTLSITGDVSANIDLRSMGETSQELIRSVSGPVLVTMANGDLSARLVHLAAFDIHALFDRKGERVDAPCAVLGISFEQGIGHVMDFRVETAKGTLIGEGAIDLVRNKIDAIIETEPKTTSILALDTPITITGALDAPTIRPDFVQSTKSIAAKSYVPCMGEGAKANAFP